jgi:DNA mismatch repair protein MutL
VGERQAPLLDDRPPGPGSEDRPQEGGALHARPAGTTGRRFSVLSIVGRALGTYLVCEDGEKIVLVDQHAAAERVTFEKLRGQYRRGRVQRQLLLVPVRCDLDETLVDAVEQNEGLLQAFGIQADPAGPDVVTVREVPVLLGDVDPRRLLSDVLAELTDASGRIEAIADEVLAAMACHVSVRAGDDLDIVEARGLLDELDRVEWSTHCPHGRPVSCEITAAELERRIGRR